MLALSICHINAIFVHSTLQEIPPDLTSFLKVCLTVDVAKRYDGSLVIDKSSMLSHPKM